MPKTDKLKRQKTILLVVPVEGQNNKRLPL